jgi:hypothetical protein
VHDKAQTSVGYLPLKIDQIFTENWLSDPATPGVGDIDVRLILEVHKLCVTAVNKSINHQE